MPCSLTLNPQYQPPHNKNPRNAAEHPLQQMGGDLGFASSFLHSIVCLSTRPLVTSALGGHLVATTYHGEPPTMRDFALTLIALALILPPLIMIILPRAGAFLAMYQPSSSFRPCLFPPLASLDASRPNS
jgi:hypothetical protein